MDISFHYCAVKTLALEAGFEDAYAEVIATFSQYIDDFNWITHIKCDNIPEWIKNHPDLDLFVPNSSSNFNPTTTGFINMVDYAWLVTSGAQKFTVSPFHFIPQHSRTLTWGKDARTTPASIGDHSFIGSNLRKAKTEFLTSRLLDPHAPPILSIDLALMQIGMLLHTFADTYAHQLFNGYNAWVNNVEVTNVTDLTTGADITHEMLLAIQESLSEAENKSNDIIEIGHMKAGHTPDLTYVSFSMNYKRESADSSRSMRYTRSNVVEFVKVSREILNYLRSLRNLHIIEDDAWDILRAKLTVAFLKHYKASDHFSKHHDNWKSVFPEYDYRYNKEHLESQLKPHSDDYYTDWFYYFNYFAAMHLTSIYGSKPRK